MAFAIVSSLSSAKTSCYLVKRWSSHYAYKLAGDLEVTLTRSSDSGGVYLYNQTDSADQFFVTWLS